MHKKKSNTPLILAQNNAGHERLVRFFNDEAMGLKGRQRRPMVVPRVSPIEEDFAAAMDQEEEEDTPSSAALLFVLEQT